MSILIQMFTVFVIKVYFYLIGDETITRHLGEIVHLNTKFNGIDYECVCQEITFKAASSRLLSSTVINRVYRVSMRAVGKDAYTHETYPMFCSAIFRYTKYPHMLAIKFHYQHHYS